MLFYIIMYKITEYTKNKLDQLNKKLKTDKITIKSSTDKNKKIDIFINGIKTNSIGAYGYLDYPNYILEKGKDYADGRRKLYYRRHAKEENIKDNKITNSWFAKYLLW